MSKAWKAAKQALLSGDIAPVYIVVGDEEWGKKKFLGLLKKQLVDPSMQDFNYDLLSAEDISGVDAVDKAGVLPMMADRRLVAVENCDKWKAADLKAAAGYLDQINDQTCLALFFNAADRRRKLFQSSSKKVRYLSFPRPRRWELAGYIRELAEDMDLKLSSEALALVAEMAGDDLSRVHRELDKLSLYKLGSNRIEGPDVAALLGRTRHVTRWELNEFLGARDLHGALVKIRDIMDSGEEAISLLSAINMFFKQLYAVKAMIVKGVRAPAQVGQALGVPPRIAETLIKQQRAFSQYELRRAFDLMRETDHRLKSYGMNRRLLLDRLVCEALTPGPLSPPSVRKRSGG